MGNKKGIISPQYEKHSIEYEELIGYEQMGREEFIVGKTRKAYSVSELLAGIEKMEERQKDFIHIDLHILKN
jgi:internalin A